MPLVRPTWCPSPAFSGNKGPGDTIARCKVPCVATYFIILALPIIGVPFPLSPTTGPYDLNIYLDGLAGPIVGNTTVSFEIYSTAVDGVFYRYVYSTDRSVRINAGQMMIPLGDDSAGRVDGQGLSYVNSVRISAAHSVFAGGGQDCNVFGGYFTLPSPPWPIAA